MLKVLKYLKKTKFSVIAIIILLCIQAMADLALPDYTSKIVNIGIQQSGIKEVSPKVIRKSKMDEILLLTNDDNEILENYELISKDNLSNKDYEKYLKEYPKLETEELYIKKNLKNDKEEVLNIFGLFIRDILINKEIENEEFIINSDKLEDIKELTKEMSFKKLNNMIKTIEEARRNIKSNVSWGMMLRVMLMGFMEG